MASRLGSTDLQSLAHRVAEPDAFDEEFVAGDLGGRAFDKARLGFLHSSGAPCILHCILHCILAKNP